MKMRLVVGDEHADAGHLAVDALDLGRMPCGDRDRVLSRLLVDLHPDARPAVDAHELAAVLGRVDDLGDVAQVDRHAVARHDDEVADVVEVGELALAAHQVGGVALVTSPSGVFWFSWRSVWTTRSTERLSAVIFSFDSSM